jgi:NADPH-dependent curcumin reductase
MINRAVVLATRSKGEPQLENFQLVELPVPEAIKGQVLLQTLWLSLDPYMRGIMDDRESYTSGVKLSHPMRGETISRSRV